MVSAVQDEQWGFVLELSDAQVTEANELYHQRRRRPALMRRILQDYTFCRPGRKGSRIR